MPRLSVSNELAALINRLKKERAEYVEQIAAIDKTFSEFGISTSGKPVVAKAGKSAAPAAAPATGKGKRKGRGKGKGKGAAKVAGKGKVGRRSRGNFAKTGEESVLDFIKSNGPVNSAQVNKHWSGEGRGGKADNTIGKLVKIGKVKRLGVKGERGSNYAAA